MSQNTHSVVFICIDCLRQDFLRRPAVDTPYLDSLRESGVEFTNCFATASTTTPAVASFMTGLYSERNGVNSLQECALDPSVPTLAEIVSEHGYETCAMVTGPLLTETRLDRGFDHYRHREPADELVGEWFDTAVETISTLSDPFFAYLHLWEIHKPIDVPDEFDTGTYGETPYGRMLSALDRAVEQFVETLPSNTTVVLHGDHGESVTFRDSTVQGILRGRRNQLRYKRGIDTRKLERVCNRLVNPFGPDIKDHYIESAHGSSVYDYLTNVPLVLSGPGFEQTRVDQQCRQIDIFPTILDHLNIDVDVSIDGKSLLPVDSVQDRVAYMRACGEVLEEKANWSRGVRVEGKKYVEYPNREWSSELYDLEHDERELHCIDDDEEKKRLQECLPEAELTAREKQDVDDRLEELGYL